MESKLQALQDLMNCFSPEEKDRILQILEIALELAHSPRTA